MPTIEERVKKVIADQRGDIAVTDIANDATFYSLCLDSLDCVEVVMSCEEEFNIEIEDEAFENIDTVQGLIDLVTNLSA